MFPTTEISLAAEIRQSISNGQRYARLVELNESLFCSYRRARMKVRFVELAQIENPAKAATAKFSGKLYRGFMRRQRISNRYSIVIQIIYLLIFSTISCTKSLSLSDAILSSRGFHKELFQLISNKNMGQWDSTYGRFNLAQRFNRGELL
jgi:hypothetical protein